MGWQHAFVRRSRARRWSWRIARPFIALRRVRWNSLWQKSSFMSALRNRAATKYCKCGKNWSLTEWRFRWVSMWRQPSYLYRTLNSPWQSCGGVRSRRQWGRQGHRHSSHLADDFSVDTMREPANRARGERVGQQQQMPILQLAPRASVSIA